MGNQIAGLVPTQIITTHQCVQEFTGYKFEKELGSSRFFKVAKIKSKDGNRSHVVKIYVIPDASLPIQDYKAKVEAYCLKKNSSHNILPYIEAHVTDRAAYLIRDYVEHSLYDRISTRPFLTIDEKKWIAFQLLCALVQIHKEPLLDNHLRSHHFMCHGDLKSENVLLTSWGWLYLADMAPFKPVCLPADNPSEFGFFFDAYSRKAAYLAPERFIESQKLTTMSGAASTISGSSGSKSSSAIPEPVTTDALGEVKVHDPDWTSSGWNYPTDLSISSDKIPGMEGSHQLFLKPSMDIFSAGCVLLELFTDGTTPFSLSQLLTYRSGDNSRLNLLDKVSDSNIKDMIRRMVTLNESERVSAEECLFMQRGKAFPEFFYKYLNIYMQNFLHPSMMNADVRVCTIHRDLPSIIERQAGDPSGASPKNGSLVIQLNILTSSIKSLSSEYSKLKALSALLQLARYLTADIVLDRIVPHMVEFLSQSYSYSSEVRRYALECVTHCVSRVTNIHSSDLNFFPEYLIPALAHLNTDPQEEVRIAFAENLAMLAETSLRFLDEAQCFLMVSGDVDEKPTLTSYDTELTVIRYQMRDIVMHCLSDPSNRVKESLVNIRSLTRLANFFGKSKANDILLSHMITFLNDKSDFNLRLSFYNELAPLVLILGSQCTPVLRSLMEQGLVDPEEAVVESCLVALSNLADWGLLSAGLMAHFVLRVVPLLSHPSRRLRGGALIYLVTFSSRASEASVFVQLVSNETVLSYFKQPVVSFNNEKVILSALGEAIPRVVFDSAVRSNQLETILDLLEERKYIRNITRSQHQPNYNAIDERIIQQFRKLQALGMTPEFEDKLLELKLLLKNIRNSRGSTFSTNQPTNPSNLSSMTSSQLPQNADSLPEALQLVIPLGNGSYNSSHNWGRKSPNLDTERNKEWQQMFMSSVGPPPNPLPALTVDAPGGSLKPQSTAQLSPTVKRGSNPNLQAKPAAPPLGEKQIKQKATMAGTGIDKAREVKSYVTIRRSPNELHQFSNVVPGGDESVKRFEYLLKDRLSSGALRLPEMSDSFQWVQGQQLEPDWKPRGILVAHLHEHLMGDVYLLAHPSGRQLVSCGGDGLVKFWDCGMTVANDPTSNRLLPTKSHFTYSVTSGPDNSQKPFKNLMWTDNDQGIATVYDCNSIHVVDRQSGQQRSVLKLQTDVMGRCVQMTTPRATLPRVGDMSGIESPLVVYTTTAGHIIAQDLRSPSNHYAWNLSQDKTHGMLLSLVVRDCHTWLVTGSSRGRLVCWDLRYQRPLSHAEHPLKASFHRLALHPMTAASSHAGLDGANSGTSLGQSSSMAPQILAACDKNNEVSSWDLETCTRVSTLWASHVPLMSSTTASRHSVRAFLVNNCNLSSGGPNSNSGPSLSSLNQSAPRHNSISIITGGTDFRLRYWDLSYPSNSSMIALRGNEENVKTFASVKYRAQVVEGTEVLIEEMEQAEESSAMGNNILRSPTRGHVNIISDLAVIEANQPFLVSASVDGVIKFWK